MVIISSAVLDRWCLAALGSPPARRLFDSGHLSSVVAVELADGRGVVVKARPPSPRIAACFAVQRHLFDAGYPCPEPLAGPLPIGPLVATAERLVPRGTAPPSSAPSEVCAALLAELLEEAPPAADHPALRELLPWVGWDHDAAATWPPPDDLDVDLNAVPGPDWVDEAGERVRRRMAADAGEPRIGHADWEMHNLEWAGTVPVAVHDWDSLAIRTEVGIAGAAAAVHGSVPAGPVAASVAETDRFLAAYQELGPRWSSDDVELAWAAGLWVLAFNAKKEAAGGGTGYLAHLRSEVAERLRRAGA